MEDGEKIFTKPRGVGLANDFSPPLARGAVRGLQGDENVNSKLKISN
jgi:hypothetical protein